MHPDFNAMRLEIDNSDLPVDVDVFTCGNMWGLHQMHGNVSEFCVNWFNDEEMLRCLRGGSSEMSSRHCRSSSREGKSPSFAHHTLGFRVSRAAGN
jgi:formylglycine-generating enzyme required for sulfatase activity